MSKKKFVVDETKTKEDLEGQAGFCPYCKSENIDFHGPDIVDGMVYYDCDCSDCGNSFAEWYEVEYSATYGYPLKTKKKGKK